MASLRQQTAYDVIDFHSKSARVQADFDHRCEVLRDRLRQQDFLENKGLGNEIGFFTFCYDASLELQMRAFVADLATDSDKGELPCNLIVKNLYDVFLGILDGKRILRAIPKQELKRGSEHQLKQLAKIATPEAFANALSYAPHHAGDVLLLTGVGEIYPFLRVHTLLDNLHVGFSDIPVIVMYPGRFNGQQFSLFDRLGDGNYYRAFDIA